jgi:Holliday junction resolvase RusA-like endonuclease
MIEPVTITLALPPQGKARARSSRKSGTHYTPAKTRAYEAAIATMAIIAMRGRKPIEHICAMDLRAVYPIPASWSEAKRTRAILGEIRPGVKPDLSNVAKAWEDAMNSIVYTDDSLIVEYGHFKKVYGITPMVAVTIKEVEA